MKTINRITAEIKFNSVYTCAACGKQEVGGTARVTFDGSPDGLKQFIDEIRQTAAHMPVGWSHFDWKFNCGCTKQSLPYGFVK